MEEVCRGHIGLPLQRRRLSLRVQALQEGVQGRRHRDGGRHQGPVHQDNQRKEEI